MKAGSYLITLDSGDQWLIDRSWNEDGHFSGWQASDGGYLKNDGEVYVAWTKSQLMAFFNGEKNTGVMI